MATGTMNGTAASHDVDALREMARGETSAVETYTQAISKFDSPGTRTLADGLTRIRAEHDRSVGVLTERIRSAGGDAPSGSGAPGTFATLVEGAAKVIGPQTALAALKQGEQIGISDYEKYLQDEDVSEECKRLFRNDLLPKCREHVAALDAMIAKLG